MQINSISSVNNNSSNKPNFKGLGTRPIVKTVDGVTTTIYPNLNLKIESFVDGKISTIKASNLKTGKVTSVTTKGYGDDYANSRFLITSRDPENGNKTMRYYRGYVNPQVERGLFYDSKMNLNGDLYLENGNSYRFEPKKTTLVERIKAARQEKSVKGFINRLLGKKAQIICTKYNSEAKPIGQAELPPQTIENIVAMERIGELAKLCK